ncbi:Peptidase_M16_C domain-containing protein [Raphanus sativus]|nr:Peptidase_M16_C domain-containing protein [Raphanus sativus]
MYRTEASRAKALKGSLRDAVTKQYDFFLQGVFNPPPLPDHVQPSKLKITTLPNGPKIASQMEKKKLCDLWFLLCSYVRKMMKIEIAELAKNPMGLLMEAVHTAGYSGALANPLYAHDSALDRLNGGTLGGIYDCKEAIIISLLHVWVLAASGVEHEELLKVVEPLITSDLPNVPRQVEPKSQYTGGEVSMKDLLSHCRCSWGGGGSFSAGGPGKGMHSCLYYQAMPEDH